MTDNPVCCLAADSVSQAARLMRREHVGPLPVISDERTRDLIGIVTDRDLAIKVVAESRNPNHTTVGDVMTRTIVVCREDEDLANALAAMKAHQIRRIPVIDQGGHLVGIISQEDVDTRIDWPSPPAEVIEHIFRAA
jgi:CBS domain-containing protein